MGQEDGGSPAMSARRKASKKQVKTAEMEKIRAIEKEISELEKVKRKPPTEEETCFVPIELSYMIPPFPGRCRIRWSFTEEHGKAIEYRIHPTAAEMRECCISSPIQPWLPYSSANVNWILHKLDSFGDYLVDGKPISRDVEQMAEMFDDEGL